MHQDAATLQVVLEGVALPAHKKELLAYARGQNAEPRLVALLDGLDDREYRSIDEVGEGVASAQLPPTPTEVPLPAEESGDPPGGEAYTDPDAEPGRVGEASDA